MPFIAMGLVLLVFMRSMRVINETPEERKMRHIRNLVLVVILFAIFTWMGNTGL